MKNDNHIHVKLEYSEAISSKRDLLASQMSLLKMATTIKKFNSLRQKQMTLKKELVQIGKTVNADLKKLEQSFPKIKKPSILQKYDPLYESESPGEREKRNDFHTKDLDQQLIEIQNRLISLEE